MNRRNTKLGLIKPINLSIAQIVDIVNQHYSSHINGASRLPVLAIHSLMTILAGEAKWYKSCTVLPLQPHIATNSRKDLIGDIHIVDAKDMLFEGYEIKHNTPISSSLIQTSFEKLRTTPVRKFYILTTYHQDSYEEFEPDIQQVAQEHGTQLIVDGVYPTLRYYLRLLRNTDEFVATYVAHLETDPSVTFQLKEAWNEIVAS